MILILQFYSAPQCSHCKRCTIAIAIPSVCPSVRPSVTRRYCVKTTARSTVQFALSDSKMCHSFAETKKYSPGTTTSPEILAPSDLYPLLKAASFDTFCLVAPQPQEIELECGPMPNLMVALPNIGGALCSTPQSLADAHY